MQISLFLFFPKCYKCFPRSVCSFMLFFLFFCLHIPPGPDHGDDDGVLPLHLHNSGNVPSLLMQMESHSFSSPYCLRIWWIAPNCRWGLAPVHNINFLWQAGGHNGVFSALYSKHLALYSSQDKPFRWEHICHRQQFLIQRMPSFFLNLNIYFMPPHLHSLDNQSFLNKWKYPCVWDVFAVSSFKLKNHQSISCFSTPHRGLAWNSGLIFSPISTISCRHSDGMILSD